MRTAAAILALAPLLPGPVHAGECVPDEAALWNRVGGTAEVPGFTVALVVRVNRRQGDPQSDTVFFRTDDVPSDTLGAGAVCGRVQLETPLPLDSPDGRTLTMQQGEWLAEPLPEGRYVAGLAAEDRIAEIVPGRYFIGHIADPQEVGWRPDLLSNAASHGRIDPDRWMIGMAGALYLVPLRPND